MKRGMQRRRVLHFPKGANSISEVVSYSRIEYSVKEHAIREDRVSIGRNKYQSGKQAKGQRDVMLFHTQVYSKS